MKFLLSLLLCWWLQMAQSQVLVGVSAQYADSFVAWDLYVVEKDGSESEGQLSLVWTQPDDWSQWQYRIGDRSGSIKTKWRNDWSTWELRGGNHVILAQPTWLGDTKSWRISHKNQNITIRTAGLHPIWAVEPTEDPLWLMAPQHENTRLDWVIEDNMEADIAVELRLMLLFLSLFHSIPKT